MIPLNNLFEFDEDTMTGLAKKAGNFFKSTANQDVAMKPKPINNFFKSTANQDVAMKPKKIGLNTDKNLKPKQFGINPISNNRANIIRGLGREASHAAKSTANFVANNQKLVGGAGLVGAGVLANKMMNRNRSV